MNRAPAAMNQSAAYGSRIEPAPRRMLQGWSAAWAAISREDPTGVRAAIGELDRSGAAFGQRCRDPDRLLDVVAVEQRQDAGVPDGIEDLAAARDAHRSTRPAPLPPASASTSARETRFTSPRRECLRHPAATANSIASARAAPVGQGGDQTRCEGVAGPDPVDDRRDPPGPRHDEGVRCPEHAGPGVLARRDRSTLREGDRPETREATRQLLGDVGVTGGLDVAIAHGGARGPDAEDLVGILFVADQDVRLGHEISHHVPGGLCPTSTAWRGSSGRPRRSRRQHAPPSHRRSPPRRPTRTAPA